MRFQLPPKLNRKAIRLNFSKLGRATWDYLFDYEKDNGLSDCRTTGWGRKAAWYDTAKIKAWLVNHNYYTDEDFTAKREPRRSTPWSVLEAATL